VEDPHTGTSVTSHAAATVNGSSNCSSTANSYAQSTALGISYTTSDSNSLCPAVANPVPVISGPTSIYWINTNCKTVTWTSSVSGGTSPYTYYWTVDGTYAGTGSSASRTFCSYTDEIASVVLTVTDAASHSGTATYSTTITVDYQPPCGTGGVPCN
jgi:hypothetical protein